MCEEREGRLARDATFGTDPLVMKADLIKSRDKTYLLMLCMVKESAIEFVCGYNNLSWRVST